MTGAIARRFAAAAVSAAATLSLSPPAVAQSGASWVDSQGRMMSLTVPGAPAQAPAPTDRTPAEIAGLFNRLCVAASSDPAAEGLTASPFTLPFGRPPQMLDIWHGPGVVVARSDRFFATRKAQCNAVFYVNTLPERQAVQDAVSAALGVPPSNAARAMRRNGRPNARFIPEWAIGVNQVVTAFAVPDSESMPGDRVHLSIRTR